MLIDFIDFVPIHMHPSIDSRYMQVEGSWTSNGVYQLLRVLLETKYNITRCASSTPLLLLIFIFPAAYTETHMYCHKNKKNEKIPYLCNG